MKMENKTLAQIKKEMETIAGDWNGSDGRYTSGGNVYTEDDATLASDIVEQITTLEGLLIGFD